jgi:L-threonylcarbamoyladenylate synthase
MTSREVADFARCVEAGGLGLFPADTVYGLATAPESPQGVARLYELKGRPAARPAAVMFFSRDAALAALPDLGPRLRGAVERLLPGALTLVLPNPARRFRAACGPEPDRLGLRVPSLEGALAPLRAVRLPVLQSSANRSGQADARRIEDVDPALRAGVDVELDGGELPGTPSTVVDLTPYEDGGEIRVLREGAVPVEDVRLALIG